MHLAGQNTMKDAYSNSLKMKEKFRRLDFLSRSQAQLYRRRPVEGQYGTQLAWTADGHLAQCGDAILQWRVSAEQRTPNRASAEHRLYDAQRGSGLRNVAWDALVVRTEFLQRADQPELLAHHL